MLPFPRRTRGGIREAHVGVIWRKFSKCVDGGAIADSRCGHVVPPFHNPGTILHPEDPTSPNVTISVLNQALSEKRP